MSCIGVLAFVSRVIVLSHVPRVRFPFLERGSFFPTSYLLLADGVSCFVVLEFRRRLSLMGNAVVR